MRLGAFLCKVTFLDFAQERGLAQKRLRLHKNAKVTGAEVAGERLRQQVFAKLSKTEECPTRK